MVIQLLLLKILVRMYNLEYIKESSKSSVQELTQYSRFCDNKLKCSVLKDVYVLPLISDDGLKGGIVDNKGNTIKASSIEHIKDCYTIKSNSVKHEHSAILINVFTTYGWGHCFTDHFSKLWFLKTELCKELTRNGTNLIYISLNNVKPPKYVVDLFNLAGLNLDNVKCVKDITKYERLYLPEDSFFSRDNKESRFYTKEYTETINDIKENVRSLMKDKLFYSVPLYFTRTKGTFSGRYRDLGEKRIENVFKKMNYKVVAPELLSVVEQIWILMNAKRIVATEGSVAHAAVFCESQTDITLIRKCDWISIHQLVINEVVGLNVTYIDANFSCFCDKKEPWHGPFYLYITNELKKYVKKDIISIPYFFDYLFGVYCLRHIYTKYLRRLKYFFFKKI